MRVFSLINNCQQKQKQNTHTHKKNPDKTKKGAPLLGLAKSIYYEDCKPVNFCTTNQLTGFFENFHLGKETSLIADEKDIDV